LTKSTCTHILRHALVCSSIKCLSRQSLHDYTAPRLGFLLHV
jgi:hypothetical protein